MTGIQQRRQRRPEQSGLNEVEDVHLAVRIEELGARLREERRERGPHEADAEWMDTPLDDWLAVLRGEGELPRPSMLALAVGMDQTLAIRDALIVSLVAGTDGLVKQVLMDFASRPHEPEVCSRMGAMLTGAFTDAHGSLDLVRCEFGLNALRSIVTLVPRRYRIQPLTIMAYVSWWKGDADAADYALRALAIDERCSLAAIVLSAIRRGVYPAWLR